MAQTFDEQLTDFDAVTPAWDGEVDQLSDFDATVDADGDITDNATGSHTGGNAIEFDFPDAVVTYGDVNLDAVNQTSGVVSFWLNPNDLVTNAGINVFLTLSSVHNGNVYLQLSKVGAVYNIGGGILNDSVAYDAFASTIDLTGDWQKHELHFAYSTGAGNDDGFCYYYIDDILVGSATGVDNDTEDWDGARFGIGGTGATSFGGSFLMDTIKIDPVGAPMVDTLAAQNGTYGLSIPVMDATARWVEFTDPTAETAVTVEYNFDPNSIVMAADEMWISGCQGAGGAGWSIIAILKYTGSVYQIKLASYDDSSVEKATSWYTITDAPHKIRTVWVASSAVGADDGYHKLYIDDVLKETVSGIDNDTCDIATVVCGARAGLTAGTYGIFYMDDCKWETPDWSIDISTIGTIDPGDAVILFSDGSSWKPFDLQGL